MPCPAHGFPLGPWGHREVSHILPPQPESQWHSCVSPSSSLSATRMHLPRPLQFFSSAHMPNGASDKAHLGAHDAGPVPPRIASLGTLTAASATAARDMYGE